MNIYIVDDDVLEFDELFIVEFIVPETSIGWNAIKGQPSTAFILIRDDDCELCRHNNVHSEVEYILIHIILYLHTSSVVEVNFNADSYTVNVAESDGQINVSLRIDGKFFVPVWAVVEISDGTVNGGL